MYTLYREGRRYQTWPTPPDLDDLLRAMIFGTMVRGFSLGPEDFEFMWVPA